MTDVSTSKTVVVTGGAQGIGRGMVLYFLDKGANVVAADIDKEAGTELENLVSENQSNSFLYLPTDVGDESSVRQMIEKTIARFNGIDALINNAGIADPDYGTVENLDLGEWENALRTNLTGTFLCSKHAIPYLRSSGNGAIVNLCSTRAFMSEPDTEPYAATKGGIYALTHALAISLGPAIRVNAISPGWIEVRNYQKKANYEEPKPRDIDHTQHPAGRVGRPNDIASLAWYLCSEEAGFITGQNFIVDGGMTRKMIYEY
ncbi:MAG TPA: SDR family oxidoreductase [Balneolales bacterium]|nr:SDR family oxidoreductase [Balneolales bacterium]